MDDPRIRSILNDQKEEITRIKNNEELIDREGLQDMKKLLGSGSAKVIYGARRSGKSILSHQLLSGKNYAYVNFDDERLMGVEKDDLDLVYRISKDIAGETKYVIFDEVQNIPGWELFINRIIREGANVIITGSSANLLSSEISTHLTGRYLPISLLPFSFREFLIAKEFILPDPKDLTTKDMIKLKKYSEDHLRRGGFPEAIMDPENANLYLRTLYDNIINKDVIGRFKPKYVRTLREMALFLTGSSSNLMSYSSLKKRFDLKSTHTAINYVGYLAEASLLLIVDRFSFRQKERSTSPKKVYSIDTGLVELLSTSYGDQFANLLENGVFLELTRRNFLDGSVSINYWRDYQDREVDMVVSRNRRVEKLIQVSFVSSLDELNKRETRSLVKASEMLGCDELLLITWDLEGKIVKDEKNIMLIPYWKWAAYPGVF